MVNNTLDEWKQQDDTSLARQSYVTPFTRADGNCLFDSVRLILAKHGHIHSISALRHTVAVQVFDDRNATILQTWVELFTDAQSKHDAALLQEFSHVSSISHSNFPLGAREKQQVYDAMMCAEYWGEEFALRALEQVLQVNILVIDGDKIGCLPAANAQTREHLIKSFGMKRMGTSSHDRFVVLLLRGKHYVPVFYNERAIFTRDELPDIIRQMFTV